MRQVLQDLRSGEVQVLDVPEPGPVLGHVLVAAERSLISSGTERALVELGGKSLLGKARARPDLARKALATAREEGLSSALAKARARLDRYSELGYSLAGRVLDTGGDPRIAPGGLVACVGAGYASHAEIVSVPVNLVVPVPEGVAAADAAFAAPAAIALHALRLADVQAGATVGVIGLGLIGQLAARLAAASGCAVVGADLDATRAGLAASLPGVRAGGLDEARSLAAAAGRGRGLDAVLVCAATQDSGPIELAAALARDRGSVVVVGDVGLELDRRAFYEKELSLVVARSYGPGRYERSYEERGVDLPVGHVRWTEARNVEAVLDLLARGALRVGDLATHRFAVAVAPAAYAALRDGALAVLLEYEPGVERRRTVERASLRARTVALRVGLVGAGTFARATLGPALAALPGAEVAAVAARSGASASSLADRLGAPIVSTDWRALAESEDVDALVIATPHAEHAEMAAVALAAGKAVYVEKPLAIDRDGLALVAGALRLDSVLLVGHNRRFAPLATGLRDALAAERPLLVTIRVAAGPLPAGHWLSDPEQGGRILGEISHFVDLAAFLAGVPPQSVFAATVPLGEGAESLAAALSFPNGSAATIAYGAGASGELPKERVEALGRSVAGVLDDFRRLELHGARARVERGRRDKGHAAALAAFVAAARGEARLSVAVEEQLHVAAASLALLESARTGAAVTVTLPA